MAQSKAGGKPAQSKPSQQAAPRRTPASKGKK